MAEKEEESELLKATIDYYRAMDEKDGPPSAKALDGGYNQTYIIMNTDDLEAKATEGNDVFFRCGNWCYKGLVQFSDIALTTESLPLLIPMLQKQQGSLRYYCNAKSVPVSSDYTEPLHFLQDAAEFIAQELISDSVGKELRKMAQVFPWIDDDNAPTYFELTLGNLPEYTRKVSVMASKTYARGLVIICIYCDGVIYFVLQSGEGDQPLLDVRFPDVSKHGQGLHIDTYVDHTVSYRKLTLWHNLGGEVTVSMKEIPKIRTLNVSSKNYEQTYIILKSSWDSNSPQLTIHHDALFRFGSWCYSGRVQPTPQLTLVDIPYVIPALRMQQSRLDYLCDVSQVPTTSPFAASLAYVADTAPVLENFIMQSEDTLKDLIDRLTNMGLGESVSRWLEGDPANSFFEFKVQPDKHLMEKFKNVELVVSKSYHPSGIITITIIFQHNIYVTLLENAGEAPLLDSRFPDVSGKGRGYQLQAFNSGTPDWPELRKVSVWQTVGALEQEFRDKALELAQSKDAADEEEGGGAAVVAAAINDAVGSAGGSAKEVLGGAAGASAAAGDKEAISTSGSMHKMAGLDVAEGSTATAAGGLFNRADSKGGSVVGGGAGAPPETEVPLSMRADEKSPSRSAGQQQAGGVGGGEGGRSAMGTPTPTPASSAKLGAGGSPAGAFGAKAGAGLASPASASVGAGADTGIARVALPHHVPKIEGLSGRMDDIRKSMGEQGLKAPWDMKGKPLGAKGGLGSAPLGKSPLGKPPLGSIGGAKD